jgi:hypothetical protein
MTTLIDAAVKWNDKKAYFFKNSQYVCYDIAADEADSGHPEDINPLLSLSAENNLGWL